MSRGKRWTFTLNNYTDGEYESVQQFITQSCSYGIIGKEVGAEGTPHLQGYIQASERYRFLSLKDKISPRSHLELARGTGEDNRRYCSKEGNFWESGQLGRHNRGDAEGGRIRRTRDELATEFVSCMDSSSSYLEGARAFARSSPGAYYFSGTQMLGNFFSLVSPPERPDICVRWYYGPPGTGKSRRAYEELPGAYRKDARTKWFNGYLGERDCVIDDFGPNGIDITRLLVWFDRYPCNVEIKHGHMPLFVTKFIVTSNFTPEDCFKDSMGVVHPQLPALLRRILLESFF